MPPLLGVATEQNLYFRAATPFLEPSEASKHEVMAMPHMKSYPVHGVFHACVLVGWLHSALFPLAFAVYEHNPNHLVLIAFHPDGK